MIQSKNNTTLKTYLRYLVPSMLGMVLVAVYTFTDTFVVGRKLGAIALGAMGICTPVLTITYALGFLFGMGGGALYSISMGKKDKAQANKVVSTSLLMLLCVGVLIAVMGNIFIEPFAYFLGADSKNIVFVMPYLRCILTFTPGFMLDIFMMTYMKNDGHPNVAMIATVVGTALNIVLDCLFVFVFDWGMFGAAIATCIGSGTCTLINIIYSLKNKLNLLPSIKNIDFGLVLRILKSGFSVFVLECSSGIVTFVFIMQATKLYGTMGSSIYTIIMNWTLICFNLMMGIAQSVQPLISVCHGAGSEEKVRAYRKYAMVSSAIAGAVFLIIGYTFTTQLISVFSTDSSELIAKTVACFRYYLPSYGIMGIGISIGIYFQSIESTLNSLVIMLSRGIVLPVIGAFVLTSAFDAIGLWFAVPCAELIAAAIAIIFLVHSDRRMNAKTSASKSQLLKFGSDYSNLVITISREFGSGGRSIGREIAARLDIPLYDKEVGEFVAAQSGFATEIIDGAEDKDVPYTQNHYTPISNQIFLSQCRVIENLAAQGSCVIVGHCADYILHGKCQTVNVFVHAPLEMRVARVVEYDHCTEKQAVRKIVESDKARENYHDFYTGMEWGKSQNYDITINSRLGQDVAVDTVLDVVKGRSNVVCLSSN